MAVTAVALDLGGTLTVATTATDARTVAVAVPRRSAAQVLGARNGL
jgi:hypothetical protein